MESTAFSTVNAPEQESEWIAEIYNVPQKTKDWLGQNNEGIRFQQSGLPWALLASGVTGHTMGGIIHKNTLADLTIFCGLQRKNPGPQPRGTTHPKSTPLVSLRTH